jgi:hypothetical protein
MDLDVEPHLAKMMTKIHNSPSKDDLGQPYKLTNQAEL